MPLSLYLWDPSNQAFTLIADQVFLANPYDAPLMHANATQRQVPPPLGPGELGLGIEN